MASEGAITFESVLTSPVSRIIVIYDRLEYVLRRRKKVVEEINRGRNRS